MLYRHTYSHTYPPSAAYPIHDAYPEIRPAAYTQQPPATHVVGGCDSKLEFSSDL